MAVQQFFGYIDDPVARAEYQRTHGSLGQINRAMIGDAPKDDIHLWKPLLKFMPDWKASKQGIGDCFHPDTIVLGEKTRAIKDVEVGDRVYGPDGTLTTVISKQVKISHQPLVTIHVLGGMPLRVTADHRVLVYRMGWVGDKRVNRAYYERKKALRRKNGEPASSVVIDRYESRTAQWVAAGEINDGDYLLTPLALETETRPDHPLLATEEGRWLFGYFLGDGHASGGSVEFAVSNAAISQRIVTALHVCGYTGSEDDYREGCGAWRVRVHSRRLVAWLRGQCYDGSMKRMPLWAIVDQHVQAGLRAADGCSGQSRDIYDSVSPSLAYGAHMSQVMSGVNACIGKFHRSEGSYPTDKPAYRVHSVDDAQKKMIWRDEQYLCRPVRKIEIAEGPHTVYDIGVAHKDHAFLADGYIAHNCVSHGLAHAILFSLAVQAARGLCRFPGKLIATEVIYGGARVEATGKRSDMGGDGASPEYGIRFIEKFGIVLRDDYSQRTGNPAHDYRVYDPQKAKEHGMYGAGGQNDNGAIDGIAKEHPVTASAAIVSLDEFVASLTNGYAIAIGCNSGYGDMHRDENGICRWTGSWSHEQSYIGLRYRNGRWQARKLQSWGVCASGPDPGVTDKAISDSSWWVDEPDLVKEIQSGSLNAISSVGNFERQDISAFASAGARMGI